MTPKTKTQMPEYTWTAIQTQRGEQHRYRDAKTGRYVSAAAVRGELDRFVDKAGRESARALTEQLRDGKIALPEWQTAMARAVKNVNYAAVAAASGGVENMTAVERGRAGGIIRGQYAYLRQFAADIESGKQPLDGRAVRRAEMYMQAGRDAFHTQKRAGAADAMPGQRLMVRSHRHRGDSCRSCIELHGRWFAMDDPAYIPVGRRECNVSCRCDEELGTMDIDGTITGLGRSSF